MLNKTFEEDISPDYLVPILSHLSGQSIVREKTLIVFDEAQLCERALASLKYFCEDAPEYHIIVAGSLLDIALNRAAEFENAIEWLCLSGITSQVYKVKTVKKPLENYRDIDAFKIYVSDLGLLCAKKDLEANDVLYMVEELNDFKGGLTENYVNVQLEINGYRTYYWASERGAEIDFVIRRNGKLIPIEVKSADNTRAKSLKVYMETYKPSYAIKLSTKNFSFEAGKKTVPLYAVFCI